MEKIQSHSKQEFHVTLKLSEDEARALYNMTVYGSKPFLEWFYRNLGKAYLKKHEKGIISLFDTIGKELPPHFRKMDAAREIFNK